MLIFALLKVSYVFKLQDKHNASYFIQNVVQPKGLQLQSYKFTMTYKVSSVDYFGMAHFFLLLSIKSNTLESLVWFGLYICPYKPKPI